MPFPLAGKRLYLKKRSRRQLPFPVTSKMRIAQISATANRFYSATVFPLNAWSRLEAYRPQVLMGSATDLQRLSERATLLGLDLRSVNHAILVLTSCADGLLTDINRVTLWQMLGVPIYELIFAPPGILLASECVAHEGWHIEPGITASIHDGELLFEIRGRKAAHSGFTGELVTQMCPCGRSGLRLGNIATQPRGEARQLAAIA